MASHVEASNTTNLLQIPANLLAAIGTVWIFCMMFLIVADVVGRNFLNLPITGVAEFAARSVASIVFLQIAAAICSGRMTRSDFLLRILENKIPRVAKFLEILNVVVGSLLFIALALIAWPEFAESISTHEYFGVQGVFTVSTWPFRGIIIVGSLFAALAYLLCIPNLIKQKFGPST
jgi:TRAP-type C4-dicarboxylate transport system permease small subunit